MDPSLLTVDEEKKIQKVIFDIYEQFNDSKKKLGIYFDVGTSFTIIEKVIKILKNEPSVLKINTNTNNSNFVIVGDIHGDLSSLISIFKQEGSPSTTKYLFLGDYVDRGKNSCEVITLLYGYKCLYPENIYLIRGNHEFLDMNNEYGFKEECESRDLLGSYFYNKVTTTYKYLPMCAILNNKIFCVHGGISNLLKSRENLQKIRKVGDNLTFLNKVQTDFLWSDPSYQIKDFAQSPRGIGSSFGKSGLNDFLKEMNFDFVIRAHQNQMDGFNWNFGENGGILTLFSAINYCDIGNEGAYAKISNNVFSCEIIKKISTNDFIKKNNFVDSNYSIIDKIYNSYDNISILVMDE